MADNLDILREKLQQLHEDYHSLKNHFDMDYAQGADEVMLRTNLHRAARALSLLLDNAMKFSRPAEATNGARFVFTLPK